VKVFPFSRRSAGVSLSRFLPSSAARSAPWSGPDLAVLMRSRIRGRFGPWSVVESVCEAGCFRVQGAVSGRRALPKVPC